MLRRGAGCERQRERDGRHEYERAAKRHGAVAAATKRRAHLPRRAPSRAAFLERTDTVSAHRCAHVVAQRGEDADDRSGGARHEVPPRLGSRAFVDQHVDALDRDVLVAGAAQHATEVLLRGSARTPGARASSGRQRRVPRDDTCHERERRERRPRRNGDTPARPQETPPCGCRGGRVGHEHQAEAARHRIERAVLITRFELARNGTKCDRLDACALRGRLRAFDHLRDEVDGDDAPLRANDARDRDRRIADAARDIEDGVALVNARER